jgi:hypothetical protein
VGQWRCRNLVVSFARQQRSVTLTQESRVETSSWTVVSYLLQVIDYVHGKWLSQVFWNTVSACLTQAQ